MDLEDRADLVVPEDREDLEVPLVLVDRMVLEVPTVLLQEERETSQIDRMAVPEVLTDPAALMDPEVLVAPAVLEVRMDREVRTDLVVLVGHLQPEARDYPLELRAVRVSLVDQAVLKVRVVLEDLAVLEAPVVPVGLQGLHLQLFQLLLLVHL